MGGEEGARTSRSGGRDRSLALADRMGIEFPPLGNLERGLTNPTFSSLLRLARGLNTELSVVIQRDEQLQQGED